MTSPAHPHFLHRCLNADTLCLDQSQIVWLHFFLSLSIQSLRLVWTEQKLQHVSHTKFWISGTQCIPIKIRCMAHVLSDFSLISLQTVTFTAIHNDQTIQHHEESIQPSPRSSSLVTVDSYLGVHRVCQGQMMHLYYNYWYAPVIDWWCSSFSGKDDRLLPESA